MPATATHLRKLSSRDVAAAVERAAGVLREGGLAVFPTETVYGVGVSVATLEGLARLRAQTPGAPTTPTGAPRPGTWHAPSREAAMAAVPLRFPLHRRALERSAPGPVRFHVEVDEAEASAFMTAIGAAPGTIERTPQGERLAISVRVPDHEIAAGVLAGAGVPVVVERLSALGWGEDPASPKFEEHATAAGIGVVLYDGPARLGRPSTVVRLGRSGSAQVIDEGAMSARSVQKRLQRVVLFVCTGNTCRSPMAEAAARHLLATETRVWPGEVPLRVISAGTSAVGGERATPEGVAALKAMGIDASDHRAQAVTRALADEAEVIYAMTKSHAKALAEIAPDAAGKVQLLDPSGTNVPDPIGSTQSVYDAAARRIVELVRVRLGELMGRAVG